MRSTPYELTCPRCNFRAVDRGLKNGVWMVRCAGCLNMGVFEEVMDIAWEHLRSMWDTDTPDDQDGYLEFVLRPKHAPRRYRLIPIG